MKIVEVSQSHVVGRGVGWLGWLGWSDFCYRLISQADCQDKAPYKISTQYLKAFKSYPIVKFAWGHPHDNHPHDIRHQPLANYSPRRNLFRRGQKDSLRTIVKQQMIFTPQRKQLHHHLQLKYVNHKFITLTIWQAPLRRPDPKEFLS